MVGFLVLVLLFNGGKKIKTRKKNKNKLIYLSYLVLNSKIYILLWRKILTSFSCRQMSLITDNYIKGYASPKFLLMLLIRKNILCSHVNLKQSARVSHRNKWNQLSLQNPLAMKLFWAPCVLRWSLIQWSKRQGPTRKWIFLPQKCHLHNPNLHETWIKLDIRVKKLFSGWSLLHLRPL